MKKGKRKRKKEDIKQGGKRRKAKERGYSDRTGRK